ncbi:MAG: hypothetical protein AAGJ38_00300 [Planctomycetota bacterium]
MPFPECVQTEGFSQNGWTGFQGAGHLTLTVIRATQPLQGDYNDSGAVEQGDLNLVLNNWGNTRTFADPGGTVFSTGNVDQEELNLVLNNWGNASVAPNFKGSAVPEPTAATLSLMIGIPLALRRRRSGSEAA